MVVWSAKYITAVKTTGIATSGMALKGVISCIPAGSYINIFTETAEVYESLRTSHDVLTHRWDSMKYCRVPQWIELIQTMCTCGCDIEVQEIDESDECSYLKMRSLKNNNSTFTWSAPCGPHRCDIGGGLA
jgi:hypothetical protein